MAWMSISIRIDRPVEEVFSFVVDPANRPLWMLNVAAVADADREISLGSQWRETVVFEEDRCFLDVEVTALQPNHSLDLLVKGPGFEAVTQLRFSPCENGTQISLTHEKRFIGVLPRMLGWLLMPKERAMLKQNFAALKKRLENPRLDNQCLENQCLENPPASPPSSNNV